MRNALYMLYLVRHGESEWNEQALVQGQQFEPALTKQGEIQAARAGGWIAASCVARGLRVSTLVSSDLRRAQQTADIVSIGVGLAPTLDPRGASRDSGASRACPRRGLHRARGLRLVRCPRPPRRRREPLLRLSAGPRGAAPLQDRPPPREWRSLSHADAIRVALAWLDGAPANRVPWRDVPLGSITMVDPQRSPKRRQSCRPWLTLPFRVARYTPRLIAKYLR